MIQHIFHQNQLLALIIFNQFQQEGARFLTSDESFQQLAYMHYQSGKVIQPHIHNPVPRLVEFTQEVLVIKRGKLRVDFYSNDRQYVESQILSSGDVVMLASGGHGFEVLEELEMFEIKQGPYVGEKDRTQFSATHSSQAQTMELINQ